MIPQFLILKNFLSYQEAALDFRGLQIACICGANGAGKSSLLEAIAWTIWGESRVSAEDDVIHIGAKEARVEFTFSIHQQTYRILRVRQRGQGTSLEFQIAQPDAVLGSAPQFRSLTTRSVRSTQQLILDHLKLDYETFVNSAYLRQGRADEFMLKRPADRKQILADLLKLQQYDHLAEQAKDQSRQFKGQGDLLEQTLTTIARQIQQGATISAERQHLETAYQQLQIQQLALTENRQRLQTIQQQRQTWQQQIRWQQQQQQNITQDHQRLQREYTQIQNQQQTLAQIQQQSETILKGYQHWQDLQTKEERITAQFQAHQTAQSQRQQYQQQKTAQLEQLQQHLQHRQAKEVALQEQLQELQRTLAKAADIEAGLAQLQQAKQQLSHLDRLHLQATPLLQRRQTLQTQLDRAATRLAARRDELKTTAQQLQAQQQQHPSLQQAAVAISVQIDGLEQLRSYQAQVREKGLERRSFMEQLQAHQRNYEVQLAEIDQKIRLLQQPATPGSEQAESLHHRESLHNRLTEQIAERTLEPSHLPSHLPSHSLSNPLGTDRTALAPSLQLSMLSTPVLPPPQAAHFPPCPLCDRPLDAHHWQLVQDKHQQEKQDILTEIWVIREQLAVSEREIQVLRQEYAEIEQKLTQYGDTLEKRGQLQAQLQTTAQGQQQLAQILAESAQIETQLQTRTFATELQEEWQLLEQSLQQLNYDERDHALARGAVERWRWAEIKQAELNQARRRQTQIASQQPQLRQQITELESQISALQTELAAGLSKYDREVATIGYDLTGHDSLRVALRQAQSWPLRHQELQQAQQQLPHLHQQLQDCGRTLQIRQQDLQTITQQCQQTQQALAQTPDPGAEIQTLEQQLQQQRQQLDQQITQLGRLQQQQQQRESLRQQQEMLTVQLHTLRQQARVYQELAQAFGKNGIQALMIENLLPQFEAMTNQILARLSANQLHVQFITQRGRKSKTAKAMETLDILIADAYGTRPYETYSGGEAFRVNFAIRLALARLLSQRSGTALQFLIVDEGFGTQDQEGCDRLIAAINGIAPEFACILMITHIPYFREAFQARIDITKTQRGSQVKLCL